MKYVSIVIFSWFLLSFKAGISYPPRYFYYVEPFKEQEIKLTLRDDSTFSMIDDFGRNKFSYTGKYKYWGDNSRFLIFYEIKTQIQSLGGEREFFPLNSGDTAFLLTEERLYIQEQPFCAAEDDNTDLLEVKYQLIKNYLIGRLGPKEFLKTYGDGDEATAKKKLVYPVQACSFANKPVITTVAPAVNESAPAPQSSKPQRTSLHD